MFQEEYVWIIIYSLLFALLFDLKSHISKMYIETISRILKFAQIRQNESNDDDDLDFSHDSRSSDQIIGNNSDNAEDSETIFNLSDIFDFTTAGIFCIKENVRDSYIQPVKLPFWNLLFRNKKFYDEIDIRILILASIGFIFKYTIIFPLRIVRLILGVGSLLVASVFISLLQNSDTKKRLNSTLCMQASKIIIGAFSLKMRIHHPENRPKSGIAVANHTSIIDGIILSSDVYYDMVS